VLFLLKNFFILFFMSEYKLNPSQIIELTEEYKKPEIHNHHISIRLLIVIGLGKGMSESFVASAFLVKVDSVRRYFRLYKEGGIKGLLEEHDE
jgi:hypothetical protein